MEPTREDRGVLRISVNSSNPDSEAEDSFSVSSYSSTTSSINPLKENGGPKENGGFIKSRHSRIGVKTATSPEKYNAHSEVSNSDRDTPNLDRSISMSNLSIGRDSPSTAREIRTITNNYQKLLSKATSEIRKLSAEKGRLEEEMQELLQANVELATESKKLLEDERDWRAERAGLMKANHEFVEEVERLYRLEEKWEQEAHRLELEKKRAEDDLLQQRRAWDLDKTKQDAGLIELLETVKILTTDNARLLREKEDDQKMSSKSNQELKKEFEEEVLELKASISNLTAQVEGEGEERERLEQELEATTRDLEKKSSKESDRTRRVDQLTTRAEDLSAKLFEAEISKDQLSQKVEDMLREEKKKKLEMDQLKVENQWLVSRSKEAKGGGGDTDAQQLKQELKAEKEKVTNLTTWKGQLAVKNKELTIENERLLSRADDLEALMNEEVTDINELIGVINNIQSSTGITVDPGLLKKRAFK